MVQDTNKQLWHGGSKDRKQQDFLQGLTVKETKSLSFFQGIVMEKHKIVKIVISTAKTCLTTDNATTISWHDG